MRAKSRAAMSRATDVASTIAGAVATVLLFPAVLSGQGLGREALGIFPADTQEIAYVNLAGLRSTPEYPQIRQRLLGRRLRDFQDFLRSAGTDPDKDLEEVVLGWRSAASGSTGFFGLAQGHFDPERMHNFLVQRQLPIRQYGGLELYASGTGEDSDDLFFVFLSSSSAAFGPLRDLKEMMDVRGGTRPALDTGPALAEWEAELEGTAAQWGVATGQAAANAAAPWLAAGASGPKVPEDPRVIFGPVRAVLYRVDWGSSVTAHVSIVCQSDEAAAALSVLLGAWRDSHPAGGNGRAPSAFDAMVQGLGIQENGSRVELTASGPLEALDQILRGSMGGGL